MPVLRTNCRNCGTLLSLGSIEGYCRRCLATVAFSDARGEFAGEHRLGSHELVEVIGEGGMGVVYRARQAGLGREVAIKVLRHGPFSKAEDIRRFRREAAAAAHLKHPNIVAVFEEGEVDGHAYFLMELVRGQSLARITRDGPIEAARAARYTLGIAQGVAAAHAGGILHRDLKPANVIVDLDDQPRITDFGLAKQLDADEPTVTQGIVGSPGYMSPEQVDPQRGVVGPSSDIYSLGALLYQLLTGRPPFAGSNVATTLSQVLRSEPVPPRQLNPAVPTDLETICLKCLSKDPAERYPTAQSLAEDLERYTRGIPILARPVGPAERLWRWCRRQPVVAGLSGGILLLLLVVAVVSTAAALRINRESIVAQTERQRAVDAGHQLTAANEQLTETVRVLELERVDDLLAAGNSAIAIAQLAEITRRDPSNHIAASRLVSALVHRDIGLLATTPLQLGGRVRNLQVATNGQELLTCASDGTAQCWDIATGKPQGPPMRWKSPVTTAKASRNGGLVATGHEDGTVCLWIRGAEQPKLVLTGHEGSIADLDFNRDGRRLASASSDKTIRVWDVLQGRLVHVLTGSRSPLVTALFSPDGNRVFGGSDRGGVRVWNAVTGALMWQGLQHTDFITSAEFTTNSGLLLTGSKDQTARTWNAWTGQPLLRAIQPNSLVHDAALSPDGETIVTACQDGTVQLWKTFDGRPLGRPFKHDGAVRTVKFSPDGRRLATGSLDVTARIWDVSTGKMKCQPLWHGEGVTHVAFTPDGSRLITGSIDALVRISDIRSRRHRPISVVSSNLISSFELSPDGKLFATGTLDGTVQLWNTATGDPVGRPLQLGGMATAVAFSRDGQWLATASKSVLRLWQVSTGLPLLTNLPLQEHSIRWIDFSPDSRRFVTCNTGGKAQVWDVASGRAVTPEISHPAEIAFVQFSPDGRRLATASLDHSARVWDSETGQPATPPLVHLDDVKHLAFSPDGHTLATASTDNYAGIWDATSGALRFKLRHTRIVAAVSFSSDGSSVVTASLDRTARIWDAVTGRMNTSPLTHPDFVLDARFSPDGMRVATLCKDSSVRLWDAKTGRPLTESLQPPGQPELRMMRFSPDGRRIAVAAGSNTAVVWHVPPTPVPVPEWFGGFAESIGGLRLGSQGETDLADALTAAELAAKAESHPEDGYYSRLARWLAADPETRTASPFSP